MRVDGRAIGRVAAVLAAVALVALGSRGDHGGGDRILVVPSTATTATRVVVLSALGVLMLGVFALLISSLSLHKPKSEPRPYFWTRVITSIMVLLLFGAGMARMQTKDSKERPPPERGAIVDDGPARAPRDDGASPAWGMAALGVLLLGLGGAFAVAASRHRRPIDPDARSLPVIATPEARDDAVARALGCDDPRQAVLLSFAAAEAVLSIDPDRRRPPATSAREWSMRVRSVSLSTIVSRYEIARFSDHAVTEGDRHAALDALRALA